MFRALLFFLFLCFLVLATSDPGRRRLQSKLRDLEIPREKVGAAGPFPETRRKRKNDLFGENKKAFSDGADRKGKVFSLFSVVNFQNSGCTSTQTLTSGQTTNRNGTCYSSTDCSSRGGSASGGCASGFGVCCVFTLTASGTVSENCTYIQNPGFPATDATETSQTFTINKCSNDVCFLRLDFETFTTQGPSVTTEIAGGACPDTFTITTPTNQMIPDICGENAGQHIYVDIGAAAGNTASLAFTFSTPAGVTTLGRTWDIKVTQVECSNPSAPPDTCLQYFTQLTGRIETFNFNGGAGQHLLNQQYSVCVRPEAGFCCVQYNICPDQTTVPAGAIAAPGFSLDGTNNMALVDNACVMETQDYISIPQSGQDCNQGATANVFSRYCGAFLNPIGVEVNVPICDCTAPFTVDVVTDATSDNAGAANALQSFGVCLEYTQIPCN